MNYPDNVKKVITEFLSTIKVEKFSEEWKAINIAITMVNSPSSFKKGVHVYFKSRYHASEEGASLIKEMSIKLYPHKIQMNRTYRDWTSYRDNNINQIFRYIYPNEKYSIYDFEQVMDDTTDLFCGNFYDECNDGYVHSHCGTNYTIETNVE